MAKESIMTSEGLKRLEDELEELKTVKRKEIAEKIKVALSFGDLSENSEYDEAKNDQAIIEGRIAEIENQLKNVRILDESELNTEIVHVGSRVRIRDEADASEETYKIVGSTEANPMEEGFRRIPGGQGAAGQRGGRHGGDRDPRRRAELHHPGDFEIKNRHGVMRVLTEPGEAAGSGELSGSPARFRILVF